MSSLKEYLVSIFIVSILLVLCYVAYERDQQMQDEIDSCRSHGKHAFVDRQYNVICIKE